MPTATSQVVSQLQRSIARAIYGKEDAIQLALITLLARGHLLIEDVPGVGKTTLAQALAKSCRASRHLSPARIAARPISDAHQNGLSLARNGKGNSAQARWR